MKSNSRRLTAREAAALLGVSLRKLRDLRAKRLVTTYRMGYRTVLYERSSLQEYLDHVRSPSCLEHGWGACRRRYPGRAGRAPVAGGGTR